MNTIKSLQALYVAMGGSADTVANKNTIPEMIDAITALIGSGSKVTLPAVTSDDNGKVLKVSEGAWGLGTDAT